MSVIMSISRPRCSVIAAGTLTPARAQRVDEAVGRPQPEGQFQQAKGTLNFASSCRAAASEAVGPRPMVAWLAPVRRSCSTVAPPLG